MTLRIPGIVLHRQKHQYDISNCLTRTNFKGQESVVTITYLYFLGSAHPRIGVQNIAKMSNTISPVAQRQYESPEPERMTIMEYITSRISTLKPPMEKVENPFTLLAMLNTQQWLFFSVRLSSFITQIILLTRCSGWFSCMDLGRFRFLYCFFDNHSACGDFQ